MKQNFKGWDQVNANALSLIENLPYGSWDLNDGQRASTRGVSNRFLRNGVLIADDVGMGKTRIAVAMVKSVIDAGGRVAILLPPGLGYQWSDELQHAGVTSTPPLLRSLWQYFEAWGYENEKERKPWFNENIILISHAFTNWRLSNSSEAWRWSLLPEVYARWHKKNQNNFPYGYHKQSKSRLQSFRAKNAADSIVNSIPDNINHIASRVVNSIYERHDWSDILDTGEYGRSGDLRSSLEEVVGLGLGIFDLVIVDEAHKSRGEESGLTRLLERLILTSNDPRRLAMTATPVELEAEQWKQILNRILAKDSGLDKRIDEYAHVAKKIRQTPSNISLHAEFKTKASGFQVGLSEYILRRSKQEDVSVQKYAEHSKKPMHTYRHEEEIVVDPTTLTENWRRGICAAESLSVVVKNQEDSTAKRLRLTLGNGHGIAALLDQVNLDNDESNEIDREAGVGLEESQSIKSVEKRLGRASYWKSLLQETFKNEDLYHHPAILAAVEEIEKVCSGNEKVLVFGKFTKPLQALVLILNARAMLKSLENGILWPQEKIAEDEINAVKAAQAQLKIMNDASLDEINKKLVSQYKILENKRERFKNNLEKNLDIGLKEYSENTQAKILYSAFKSRLKEMEKKDKDRLVNLLSKAILETLGISEETDDPKDVAEAYIDLLNAITERDEGDANNDGILDDDEAQQLWDAVEGRLVSEFGTPRGGFARLMYGATQPETRRVLQAAFNRLNAYPKVLVAQSIVGREGLNLHRACRTVVLLHPEWNPGVVEQQIGRVDRVNSLWAQLLDAAIEEGVSGEKLPQIHIRPVIFRGTYDEKNWEVLRERWDDLRAQLHGIVISPRIAEKLNDEQLVKKINDSAPKFSP